MLNFRRLPFATCRKLARPLPSTHASHYIAYQVCASGGSKSNTTVHQQQHEYTTDKETTIAQETDSQRRQKDATSCLKEADAGGDWTRRRSKSC